MTSDRQFMRLAQNRQLPASSSTAALIHRMPPTTSTASGGCVDDWSSTPCHLRRGSYVIATQTDAAAGVDSPLTEQCYVRSTGSGSADFDLQQPAFQPRSSRSSLSLNAVHRLPFSRSTSYSREDSSDFRRPATASDDVSSSATHVIVNEMNGEEMVAVADRLFDDDDDDDEDEDELTSYGGVDVTASRTPQRKNSYVEATHCDIGGLGEPEVAAMALRSAATAGATANHHPGGRSNALLLSSSVDDNWRPRQTDVSYVAPDSVTFAGGGRKDGKSEAENTPGCAPSSGAEPHQPNATRNIVVISLSFVLVLSAFRSVQSLETSLNDAGQLGATAMACVHASMCMTDLTLDFGHGPSAVTRLTSKWTMVVGLTLYVAWIAANSCPHPYTLFLAAVVVGIGQSLVWSAQVVYVRNLRERSRIRSLTTTTSTPTTATTAAATSDSMHAVTAATGPTTITESSSAAPSMPAVAAPHNDRHASTPNVGRFRCDGVFLAGFQTSHVWGNVISSLLLGLGRVELRGSADRMLVTWAPTPVLKLMGSYLVFVVAGFALIVFCLEKTDSPPFNRQKPCVKTVNSLREMLSHKTRSLLVPLLIFNGFEQGFVYADYTKSYVACTLGIKHVAFNMVIFGLSNAVFSLLVSCAARHVAREALVGIGCVLQLGLLVFLLVWIPDQKLVGVFFVVSGLLGACDAVWQTQCNGLVILGCACDSFDQESAFRNFRFLQGLGAAMAFASSASLCVTFRLYVIIGLLSLSILFYVAFEYQIRRPCAVDVAVRPAAAAATNAS